MVQDMKKTFYWIEKQFKRFMYKKYLVNKDIQMAIRDNSLERVFKIVPKHSRDIFMKELVKQKPELIR